MVAVAAFYKEASGLFCMIYHVLATNVPTYSGALLLVFYVGMVSRRQDRPDTAGQGR